MFAILPRLCLLDNHIFCLFIWGRSSTSSHLLRLTAAVRPLVTSYTHLLHLLCQQHFAPFAASTFPWLWANETERCSVDDIVAFILFCYLPSLSLFLTHSLSFSLSPFHTLSPSLSFFLSFFSVVHVHNEKLSKGSKQWRNNQIQKKKKRE